MVGQFNTVPRMCSLHDRQLFLGKQKAKTLFIPARTHADLIGVQRFNCHGGILYAVP